MKLLGLLLLVGFAASDTEVIQIFFSEGRKIYTSKHDIVNIFVPLNNLAIRNNITKMVNDTENELKACAEINVLVDKLFFVQGDYENDGTFEYKGLFVLKPVMGEATKLLDNGVDFTSRDEERKKVYFAATDGIYLYNAEKNTAEKYGSLTDNIISIAQTKTEDVIYALTAQKVLYKVTENGEKKEKVDDVKDAQQIVLDSNDNLYFYDSEKRIFVKKYHVPEAPLIQFMDLPKNPNKIKLVRQMIGLGECVFVILDERVIQIDADGKFVDEDPSYKPIASAAAHSMEGFIVFYMAYNKSIYEFNRCKLFLSYNENPENSVDDKKDHIHKSATRLRSALRRAHANESTKETK